MTPWESKLKQWNFSPPLQVAVLFFFIVLTRGIFFWETFIHSDEALFALSTKIWQNGGIPYHNFFENKPLGVYIFYSLGSLLSGSYPDISIRAIHIFSFFWTLLTAWTLRAIAMRVFSPSAGFLAALFFVLFSTFWGPDIIAIHIEVVLLLPLCLSILILMRSAEKLRYYHSFISGLLASIAFLTKYQAGILLPILFIYLWIILWRTQSSWNFKRALGHSLSLSLGFFSLVGVMLGYLYLAGAWEGFYFWNIYGNYTYIRDGNLAKELWHQMFIQSSRYLGSTLLLWVLAGGRLIYFLRNRNNISSTPRAFEWFLWTWFFFTFVPVSVGMRFEDHYFLLLTPPLSILSAGFLHAWSAQHWKKWASGLALMVLLPTVVFTGSRYFMYQVYDVLGGENMNDYRGYGEILQENTDQEDYVFVWGCAPAVYLYANRRPATRFLRTDVLAGRVAGLLRSGNKGLDHRDFILPGSWDMLLEDLEKYPPALIMDTAPTGHHDFEKFPLSQYPQIQEFLGKNYRKEPSFMGAEIYRRISSEG